MSDIALRVEGLGKRYRLGLEQASAGTYYRYKSLRDTLSGFSKAPVKTMRSALTRVPMNETNSFWALKDINFEVKKGEVVGIIGRNGAGKSTLLKILSRITKPTTGHVALFGRVGSLLEVGTGFHPELSGRENIYLNGAILGMTRAEVKSKFDEIVAFSEIEKFLDTPVKQYSSGMYMRLAFAVAAHLEPEILVVDEVLAVGDAAFQKKCLGKMKDVASEGRTVLFVSHNMAAVSSLCTSGVLLAMGRLAYIGNEIDTVVSRYLAAPVAPSSRSSKSKFGISLDRIALTQRGSSDPLQVCTMDVDSQIAVDISNTSRLSDAAVIVRIYNAMEQLVTTLCTPEEGVDPFELSGKVRIRFDLGRLCLLPGYYRVDAFVFRPNDSVAYLQVERALEFEVLPAIVNGGMWPYRGEHGVCRLSRGAVLERSEHAI